MRTAEVQHVALLQHHRRQNAAEAGQARPRVQRRAAGGRPAGSHGQPAAQVRRLAQRPDVTTAAAKQRPM